MWRAAAVVFLSSIVVFRSSIDGQLAILWSWLQNSSALLPRMFRHDHWEWGLAVAAFIVWIHGFWLADNLVRRASRQGRVHPWRKFRLHDRYEFQKLRREAQGEDTSDLDNVNPEPAMATKQTEWNWKAWIVETPVYMVPLYIVDKLIPRRAAKIAAWGAPTAFQICRDVTAALFIYDTLFFCGHYMMHKIPFLHRTMHKKHHLNKEVRAAEIVRLSMPEEVMEVGFSIITLNCLGAHPVARSLYNCIITFLLTELHCGFDFPWTPQNVVPFGFATGSRRHHYHHRFGKHYYQKFFCHVDRIFGHIQKDDGTLLGETVQPFENVPESWAKAR